MGFNVGEIDSNDANIAAPKLNRIVLDLYQGLIDDCTENKPHN